MTQVKVTKKQVFKRAFRDSIPVLAGYIVLGIGFGILLKLKGFGLIWSLVMSTIVFAGAMQYVGVGLLAAAAPLTTVALTTILVNARHLFYGVSMVDKYKGMGKIKPYLIFALSDETYSILCLSTYDSKMEQKAHSFFVSMLDHSYWIIGSCIGSVIGGFMNFDAKGIDFALTALFVTIMVQQWLTVKNHIPVLIGIGASAVCRILFGADNFLIPSMVAILLCMVIYRETEKRKEKSKEGDADAA